MKKRDAHPEATEREREDAPPPGNPPASADADAADPRDAELARLRAEAETLKSRLLEATADLDNQAKRFVRERQVVRDEIVARTAREMLEVIDNLDRTLASAPPDRQSDPFIAGVQAIRAQFEDKLRGLGVVRIDALGQPFDPFSHEALAEEPRDDVAPGTVIDEIASGWRMGPQLVRASKVRVARAP